MPTGVTVSTTTTITMLVKKNPRHTALLLLNQHTVLPQINYQINVLLLSFCLQILYYICFFFFKYIDYSIIYCLFVLIHRRDIEILSKISDITICKMTFLYCGLWQIFIFILTFKH